MCAGDRSPETLTGFSPASRATARVSEAGAAKPLVLESPLPHFTRSRSFNASGITIPFMICLMLSTGVRGYAATATGEG